MKMGKVSRHSSQYILITLLSLLSLIWLPSPSSLTTSKKTSFSPLQTIKPLFASFLPSPTLYVPFFHAHSPPSSSRLHFPARLRLRLDQQALSRVFLSHDSSSSFSILIFFNFFYPAISFLSPGCAAATPPLHPRSNFTP